MECETLIDSAALSDALKGPSRIELVVLDCRFDLTSPDAGRLAYFDGHIPTARYVDLNRDLSASQSRTSGRHPLPAAERAAARFAELGVRKHSQVVVYDESNGSFAARAWWLLRWLGHRRVAVLDGGIRAWRAAGGEMEMGGAADADGGALDAGGATDPGGGSLAAGVDSHAVVGTADLAELLRQGCGLLVDARAAERFAGTVEPIDPVAGHIPGAVNHPFSSNLSEDGRFLPPAELERRWRERLGGTAPGDTIAMCGSGVTACHNLLAMEIAGLPGAKLYAGSWSEWIRDPARAVARG